MEPAHFLAAIQTGIQRHFMCVVGVQIQRMFPNLAFRLPRACSLRGAADSTLPHLLRPSNGVATSVCFLPLNPWGFPRLTNDSAHRTQSPNLRSGLLPPSYAFPSNDDIPLNQLNHSPPPYSPGPAPVRPPGIRPPGPAHVLPPTFTPHFTNRLAKGKLSICTGRGLAICFAIMISLQVALIIRASKERERMRRDIELWEKAREDRVPHDAFWDVISPALDCRAYDKREYSAILQNVPEGWTAIDACMNNPVEIEGVTIRRPYRCAFVDGSPHTHGYWMVDWGQLDCRPWYRDFHDLVSPRFLSICTL